MNILFLLPYPVGKAPSQRFRVEALLPLLDQAGYPYTLSPFMTVNTWQVLYKGGSLPQKAAGILKGYWQRAKTVFFGAGKYSHVFIHREAAPLGPPVFEWYLSKILKKKIIYDFDDAIWIPNTSEQNKLVSGIKSFGKIGYICKRSSVVSAGNDFLCDYARKNGAGQVARIPTVVDTELRYNTLKEHEADRVQVVGWTGSHSTLRYLDDIVPILQRMQEQRDFVFLVIADKKPDLKLRNWQFQSWSPTTEIKDLLKMDIGIMPLTRDPWSEGKCGFKLIQYMALGIPAVASSIGVNSKIIEDGTNGYLCQSPNDFEAALTQLLDDAALRQQQGREARKKIVAEYSISAIKQSFLRLFE